MNLPDTYVSKRLPSRRRILVIRYRFIGDTLLMVPFLRNLRRAYPHAHIDVLAGPVSGELLRDCPYIDECLVFDTTRKHRYENEIRQDSQENPRSFSYYVQMLRERQYDTAFVLKRSFSSAALVAMAGIPQRIGFNTEWRRLLLTKAVPYRKNRHERDCFLDVLHAVDIPINDAGLEAWWGSTEEHRVARMWGDVQGKRHVLLHLTASNPAKEWPLAVMEQLAAWLMEEEGCTLHAVGTEADHSRYDTLVTELLDQPHLRFYNWCGETTLLESLALIKRMDFAVAVDSGTLHMATAVNIPVIGLYNKGNAARWSPVEHHHSTGRGGNHMVVTERSLKALKDACLKQLSQLKQQGAHLTGRPC